MTFLKRPLGTILRFAVSIGLLAWLATRVDWQQFRQLQDVDARFAIPALLVAGLAYPLQAWRWQLLLRAQGFAARGTHLHGVFWVSQFYNSFLPGGVAGDAIRLAWLWREQPARKADAAASLLADRLLGFAALLALAVVALALHVFQQGATREIETLFASSVVALVGVLAFGLLFTRPGAQPLIARAMGKDRASQLYSSIAALGSHHTALVSAAALSVAVWLLDFVALGLLAHAVGVVVGPLQMAVAAAAAYVAATLPVSIGGHGVREGALVAVLMLFNIGASEPGALPLLAIAFWAVSVFWSLVGGVLQVSSLVAGWPLPRGSARA